MSIFNQVLRSFFHRGIFIFKYFIHRINLIHFSFKSFFWILTEVMDTSIYRFYVKVSELKLQMNEVLLAKVAYNVVSALEYMEHQQIMHRDIKPSNILINSTGEIKICDFSISGFMTNSMCSTYKGCEKYMPVHLFRLINKFN